MSDHPHPIRILIADDHPVVRAGLVGMLAKQPAFDVAAEAENGQEAVALAQATQVDVILMDLRMPVLDGVEALRQIRAVQPTIQVLILTTYDDDADILAAVQAGAVGYLLKDAPREEIYRAIHAAARGQVILDPAVTLRLMQQMRQPRAADLLSEREIEVLRLVSEGQTNKQIGKRLHISEATVKTHLVHIFEKLQVPDRAAAVRTAIERHILTVK